MPPQGSRHLRVPVNRGSVKDVFPDKNGSQVCQEVLDYFGSIAGVGQVLGGLPHFSHEQTVYLLKNVKKSDSMVKAAEPSLVLP